MRCLRSLRTFDPVHALRSAASRYSSALQRKRDVLMCCSVAESIVQALKVLPVNGYHGERHLIEYLFVLVMRG